jgi:hypothetical protein
MYHGILCLKYATSNIPRDFYPKLALKDDRSVLVTLSIATAVVKHFVNELREFVVTEVNEAIKIANDADGSEDIDQVVRSRRDAIRKWVDLGKPFLADLQRTSLLVRALYHHPSEFKHKMQYQKTGHTLRTLVDHFYIVATSRSSRMIAPLHSRSITAKLLPIAYSAIRAMSPDADKLKDVKDRFNSAFIVSFRNAEFQHMPAPRVGAPSQLDHLTWIPLVPIPEPTQAFIDRLESGEELTIHPSDRLECKRRGSWDTTHFDMNDIGEYIHQETPPTNFNLKHASLPTANEKNGYVLETFQYVFGRFSIQNPIHQLIMMKAIVFSKLAGKARHDKGVPPALMRAKSRGQHPIVNDFVRGTPWTDTGSGGRNSTKGFTDQSPFVVMVTVYAIALLDPESPLRQRMRSHKQAIGGELTNKLSK